MPLTQEQILQHIRAGAVAGTRPDTVKALRAMAEGDLSAEAVRDDLRAKSRFVDDFLAALIDTRISSTAGAGTGNAAATTVAGALNGQITLKSASDDGTHAQNFSTMTLDQLNYKANQGGLMCEARCSIDDVSEAYFFFGFTDTISTTVEGPIFMNAAVIDSDADNACGIVYDIDATTDIFYVGGVKATTDTDPVGATGVAPVDATVFTARVEVDTNGTVRGYIDGRLIGEVANAVTVTTALTPAIFIGNRSANQVTLTVDYWLVEQNR